MPLSSYLSFLGIAKEATPGTAVAATAFIPVTDMKPAIKVAYLPDESMRSSNAKTYGEVAGVQYAEYEFSGPVYPDTIGWPLTGVLGELASVGGSAPFTHTINLLNSTALTPTYTLSDYNGFNTRQFAGFRFSEVTFKFAGSGLLEYTAKGVARTFGTATKPTQSFTAIAQQAAWVGVSTIVATPSTLITDGELTIKRTVAPIHNVDGTVSPYDIFDAGDLECTGQFTAVYEDDTIYANYLGGTQVALDFNWTQGAAAALTQVKLHMSTAQIDDADISRSQSKHVELSAKFTGLANTTDKGASGGYGPIVATLQNAVAANVYK